MKKKKIEMLFLFLAAFLLASCSSDDDSTKGNPNDFSLTLNPTDGQFTASSASFTLKIETTENWTVSSDQSWCKLSINQGNSTYLVNGSVEANTSKEQRTANITVKVRGVEKKVTLTQIGAGAGSITVALTSPADGNVAVTGNTFTISVVTNGNWEAATSQDWCTLTNNSGIGNGTITGEIPANEDQKSRTVQITVTAVGGQKGIVTLTQKGKDGGSTDPDPEKPQGNAGRIEIPKLKGGDSNLFYTHTVNHNGDNKFINYSAEYNCSMKHTRWVAYVIDNVRNKKRTERTDKWGNDNFIPSQFQTKKSDYDSPYNRGHLVASGDRTFSYEANVQTFLYSNMSPQIIKFNGGIWNNMENKVRAWADGLSAKDTVYVAKGGYIDGTVADGTLIEYTGNHVAVPRYYFMAVLSLKNGAYKAMAFWIDQKAMANTKDAVEKFAISVADLEAKTNIDFFHNLPDAIEQDVEKKFNKSDWNW